MAEAILTRGGRISSAAAEDPVDRLEQAGGEAVMREAIREADRAVDAVRSERDAAMARRQHAACHREMLVQRVEALTEKARLAIDGGRDDLAETALAQRFDLEAHARALEAEQAEASRRELRLDGEVAALRARKALMEETLSAVLAARREAAAAAGSPHPAGTGQGRLEAAERAFARVMAGFAPARKEGAATADIAEIDALQRRSTVAGRLTALKAQAPDRLQGSEC